MGVTLATVAYVSRLAERTVSARVTADLERSRKGVAAAEAEQFARLRLIAELVASFPELRALLATDAATVRDFLADYPVPFPHFKDPDLEVAASFNGVQAFPTTAFYDPRGDLAFVHQGGYASEADLAEDIDKYAR